MCFIDLSRVLASRPAYLVRSARAPLPRMENAVTHCARGSQQHTTAFCCSRTGWSVIRICSNILDERRHMVVCCRCVGADILVDRRHFRTLSADRSHPENERGISLAFLSRSCRVGLCSFIVLDISHLELAALSRPLSWEISSETFQQIHN